MFWHISKLYRMVYDALANDQVDSRETFLNIAFQIS